MMLLLPIVALLAVEAAGPTCQINGRVTAGTVPLPGVALTVSDGSTDVATSSTDLDGAYRIVLPAAAKYTLTAALSGFAGSSQDVELLAESCTKQLDFSLTLKSRVAAAPTAAAAAAAAAAPRPT